MGRKNYKALKLVLLCVLFAACVKDKPVDPIVTTPVKAAKGNVYIVCEGQYGYGNASLGLYVPSKDSVYEDLYKAVNQQALGDVFQSIEHIGSNYFLCVNNSNKITVINDSNWKFIAHIPVYQPRYILPVSSTRAYVSSLYSNKVYIINTQGLAVVDSVCLPTISAESMLLYNYRVFSCSWDTGSKSIYELNILTESLSQADNINASAPQEILIDKEQKLWILSGDAPEGKNAVLTRMDPDTKQILRAYSFDISVNPVRPVFNNTKDTLYFIEADYNGGIANNGIYRMGINEAILPTQAFIAAGQNQYFWALGIDPLTGNIYVGDPKGFTQKGSVGIYKPDGALLKTFKVGIGPGHFYFD